MIMEDFYIKCNSKEESELCETWAINNKLNCCNNYSYGIFWPYFIVANSTYTLNDSETYDLPEKTLSDLGINTTTEKDWSKASKEELLEEAKRRYTIGTKFKCLVTNNAYIIPKNIEFRVEHSSSIFSYVNNNLYHKHFGVQSNKWAEIVSTPEVKETSSDSKFIVGKWYKCRGCGEYIIKFKEVRNNNFITDTGYIHNSKYKINSSNGAIIDIERDFKEVSLEEIQQYLPENHPDKIPNKVEMKTNETPEFKVGDWIVVLNGSTHKKGDIVKLTYEKNGKFQTDLMHAKYPTFSGWFDKYNSRPATQEEIDSVTKPKEITESIKPNPKQYDLSTTITRAVKNNDPSIIVRESGKSVEELCEFIRNKKENTCLSQTLRLNIKDCSFCSGLSCIDDSCPFKDKIFDNFFTNEQQIQWIKGEIDKHGNPKNKKEEPIIHYEEDGLFPKDIKHIPKKSLSDYDAVHVDTQEKWDFVSNKLGYTNLWSKGVNWNVFKQDTHIGLNRRSFCDSFAYRSIVSFEEWLDLTGYKNEWWFKPKKGNDSDIDKSALKNPLTFEECVKEKPEFSLFPDFVSKIN